MLFTLSLISVNIFSSPEYTQLTPTTEISQICCKESMGRLRSRELLLVILVTVDFIVRSLHKLLYIMLTAFYLNKDITL